MTRLYDGVVAACPAGGAEGVFRGLEVDLDRRSAQFVDQGPGEPAPERITLDEGETEAFRIEAFARESDLLIEWWLKLAVVDGSARVSVRIDDDGEPFRTAGTSAADTPGLCSRTGGGSRGAHDGW